MGRSPSDLTIFVGTRLLQLIPVTLGVLAIVFFFTHIAVTDPCAGWVPKAKRNVLQACITYFGLNQPLDVQFYRYLVGLLAGNWGFDPQGGLPVLPVILQHVPPTVELVLTSLAIMIIVGIPLGVVAAANAGRWPDHLVRVFYLSGWAAPTYLVGLIFVTEVAPAFGFPTRGEFTTPPAFAQPTHLSVLDALLAGSLSGTGDAIAHLILPATALAFLNMGIVTRMTRASMLEALPSEFIKTARMKGLSEFVVQYRHALRNSLISTVTVLGFTASGLLAGTIVIEELFGWPGIGEYAFDAFVNTNFAGGLGVVIVFAIGVVIANMAADLLYGVLDPRVDWR